MAAPSPINVAGSTTPPLRPRPQATRQAGAAWEVASPEVIRTPRAATVRISGRVIGWILPGSAVPVPVPVPVPDCEASMPQFDHEKLEVYQAAIRFVVLANDIVEALPRGRGYLGDQLSRAATPHPSP